MKSAELRQQDAKELERSAAELKKKLSDIRFNVSGSGLKNTNEIKHIKKDIARILTVLQEIKTKKQ